MSPSASQATRTIFFHIGVGQQILFYLLAAISTAICVWGVVRRLACWRAGRPMDRPRVTSIRLRELFAQVVAQRRVRRRTYAGRMHVLLFAGFCLLFTGTCIVAVEHYGALIFGPHWLYRGWFYLGCKAVLDLAGLGLFLGALMALGRRLFARPKALGHTASDNALLGLICLVAVTGWLLEGAGIAADPRRQIWEAWSPIGRLFALLCHGIGPAGYTAIWWVHIPLVLTLIALLPWGRWLHLFTIPASILLQPERSMGALRPESMADVEASGRIGLGALSDLDQWQLLSLDACMECGRCTDACPANAAGKSLNPKQIVLDLRALSQSGMPPASGDAGPSTDVITDEALWACTNCHACVRECPALIRHVDIIDGIRRYRVAEGRLKGPAAVMLRQLTSRENPWGLPAAQRLDWAKDLDVAPAAEEDGREVLLWVGCAGAFEPKAQATTRAIAQLLNRAGVKFTVLGARERCTGDPARRTGDEFLFQQLAEANVSTLEAIKAKIIVTQCPHCFHTIKNEYPQFGGTYRVMHHTQFLQQLVADGRLKTWASNGGSVTYHDPCFLGRVNRETEAPRALLRQAGTELHEPPRHGSKTFCCGAGGGRMWMEDAPSERPGMVRAVELTATGAATVAVACPFCRVMVGDSVAAVGGDKAPRVADIAELLLEASAERAAEPERT
ncbi:MAG: 4Fe-4S dicluster domain-containing protein [Armatimonadetes bacterium]|nr:4Fe-4S dicluster domain-containing protein [Armatimonadota bacterium]MDE2206053.1 4Fe-4S dicluster domain-containing protein [Armatimonadota bacterium]